MSDDARVPSFKMKLEDEQAQEIHPDWTLVVSNQLTIITQQSVMIENQKQMINELRKIAGPAEKVIANQAAMTAGLEKMAENLATSVNKVSGLVSGLMKIPIAIVVMTAASFAFLYMNEISETTWLIIMGVAVFPWLGESIEAMMKLVGIRQGPKNGTTKQ